MTYSCVCACVCGHMCSLTSDCDALDCNPPGGSLHRIFLDNPEYWSRLPFPPLGDLPDPGIEPLSCVSSIGKQILYHCTTWGAYSLSVRLSVCPIFPITFGVSRKCKICPLMWWNTGKSFFFFFLMKTWSLFTLFWVNGFLELDQVNNIGHNAFLV